MICSSTPAGRTWPRLAALSVLRSTLCTVSAPATTHYGAQSHTPRNRCVRFVAGVAVGSRNTCFQAACWALPGSDLHRSRQLCLATSQRRANCGNLDLLWLITSVYFVRRAVSCLRGEAQRRGPPVQHSGDCITAITRSVCAGSCRCGAIRISQDALPVLVSRRSRARGARSTGRKP